MIKPAIVAVGYNRPDSMKRLLASVTNAYYPFEDIDLIISIDESDKSDEVQTVAEAFEWKHGKRIIKRYPERQGLRNHIIQCGDLSEKYGAVIILEDDLVVSPSFYHYTYNAVNQYSKNEKIAGVALYSHAWNGYADVEFTPIKNEFDTYFGQYSITWGECWTFEQWRKFKEWYFTHENKLPDINYAMPSDILRWGNQSWGKYFVSYIVEKDLYYIIPYNAMTTNFSEIGQHNNKTDTAHQVSLQQGKKTDYKFPDFSSGIKYDIFFERIFEKDIADIIADEISVNLNGTRLNTLGKRYLLTTKPINNIKPIASFGIRMRPIDANIDYCIPGNDILLYDVKKAEVNLKENDISESRALYETYHLSWRLLLKVGLYKFVDSLDKKIKKCAKRKNK